MYVVICTNNLVEAKRLNITLLDNLVNVFHLHGNWEQSIDHNQSFLLSFYTAQYDRHCNSLHVRIYA